MRVLSLPQHSRSILLLFQLLQPSLAMQRVIYPLGLAGGDAVLLMPCLMQPMELSSPGMEIPKLPLLLGQPWKDAAHPCVDPIGIRGTAWVMLSWIWSEAMEMGKAVLGRWLCPTCAQSLGSMGTLEMGGPWDEAGVPSHSIGQCCCSSPGVRGACGPPLVG